MITSMLHVPHSPSPRQPGSANLSPTDSVLSHLPSDILLAVCAHVAISDLLALKRTCRDLYAFVETTDYLWHRCASTRDLPLDLGTRPLVEHSAAKLQVLLRRATQLDENWRNAASHVHAFNATPVTSGISDVSIDQTQLSPGGRWLVTAQRNRRVGRKSTTYALWCLCDAQDIYLVTTLEIYGECRRFSMDTEEEKACVHLAVSVSLPELESLRVFKFALPTAEERHAAASDHLPVDVHDLPMPLEFNEHLLDQVVIAGKLIAQTVVAKKDQSVTVLLRNLESTILQLLHPTDQDTQAGVILQLTEDHLLVMQTYVDAVVLHTYRHLYATSPLDAPISSRRVPVPQCASAHISRPVRTRLSGAEVGIYAFSHYGLLHCARLTIGPDARDEVPQRILAQNPMAVAHSVAAGVQRAVWLEYDYNADATRCVKLSWGGVQGIACGELLAPFPQVPVRPADCRSLAFDEATGRLCLGLFSGITVVLDYAPRR